MRLLLQRLLALLALSSLVLSPLPASAQGNSLGVSGFGGEVANPDDLKVRTRSR